MNFLSKYIIYNYNDMAAHLIKGLSVHTGDFLYYGYTNNNFSTKFNINPITTAITDLFWKLFDPITANNVLVTLAFILNLFLGYKLFNYITKKKSKYLSLLYSMTWALSPYFLFRVMALTVDLYFVFVFPILLFMLFSKVKPFYLGFYNLIVFLLSVYYGYFAFLTIVLWMASEFIYKISVEKIYDIKSEFKKVASFLLPLLIVMLGLYGNIILANIKISPKYKEPTRIDRIKSKTVFRPIENFYNFSLRPWYFAIPPKSSLFFSELSNSLYEKIESTDYYLADDYHDSEMGGSFLGWPFLIGLVVLSYFILTRKLINREITVALIVLLFLFAFTEPPSFTLSGHEIYTPSYLLYLLVPGFRVISRLAVVIFLITTLLNLAILQEVNNRKLKNVIGTFVFLANFFVLSVKLPIINVTNPPDKYKDLSETSNRPEVVLALPNAEYEDTFWILYYKKYLYNPRGFINSDKKFDADIFTNNLVENDLNKLSMLGIDTVIVSHNNQDSNVDFSKFMQNFYIYKETVNYTIYKKTE